MKILLVDDDKIICLGLKKIIERFDDKYRVIGEVKNGEDALRFLENEHPDLIISDVKMPKMNGIQLCENVKQKYPNIKIVMLSGFDEYEYVRPALKAGANDYLLKPIDNNVLRELLEKIGEEIVAYKDSEKTETKENGELDIYVIKSAKEYIKKNYYKDLKLKDVAEYTGLNANYFSTIFKRETSKNFIDYVSAVRIEEAKKLLKKSSLKIYEVGYEVGYNDVVTFNRAFKRITGISPKDYRNNM